MHILLVADGRSPTTLHWLQGVRSLGHIVSLVSTFPCEPIPGVEAMLIMPVAFAGLAGGGAASGTPHAPAPTRNITRRWRNAFLQARYRLGPFTLPGYGRRFKRLVEALKPDLIHALRIPFEGMLAAYAPPQVPLAVSIWGNDLTLHARGSSVMNKHTRRTLRRANGLLADTRRDVRLALSLDYDSTRPTLVVPGNGGIDLTELRQPRPEVASPAWGELPEGVPLVINPRGFRPGSVRNDTFFQSIPFVLLHCSPVLFLCPGMAGQPEAMRWVQRLHLKDSVRLLPHLPQEQLWDLFQHARVTVSISSHDGTPNSLLEAMTFGCFPVAGDIESLREWITPGVNGLLVQPDKPQSVAEAVRLALENPELRQQAARINLDIIRQRAEVNLVRAQVEVFYQGLVHLKSFPREE